MPGQPGLVGQPSDQLAPLRASQNPFPYESRISVPQASGSLPVHTDTRGVGDLKSQNWPQQRIPGANQHTISI